jgi:hypothetical protein
MQQGKTEEQALDRQLDEICDGFREAVDREIETLQREGLPIYVADNGRIVDLQKQEPCR